MAKCVDAIIIRNKTNLRMYLKLKMNVFENKLGTQRLISSA